MHSTLGVQPVQHMGRVCALHAEGPTPKFNPKSADRTNKMFIFCSYRPAWDLFTRLKCSNSGSRYRSGEVDTALS